MTANTFLDRRAITWLVCLLLPMAFVFGGTLSEYALPISPDPVTVTAPSDSGKMQDIARIGRWIAQIPNARIVFPSALILSVWLMSLIVAYGRARYFARKERKAEARLFDELVNRSRVGYLAVDERGKISATNPALEALLGSVGGWEGADLAETGVTMSQLVPGEVVVVKLNGANGDAVPALAAAMSGDDDTHTQIIITPLQDAPAEREDQGVPRSPTRNTALLRNINHELRTPLAVILGSATLLESDVSKENADLVDAIRIGGERLLHILETLVLLSELEADDNVDQVGNVELLHVLNEVVAKKRVSAEAKGLELIVDIPDRSVHVQGDVRGVEHIFGQLIDNAIKFTEAGSVRIRCACDDDEARVSVADTGVGMSPAMLDSVLADFRDQKKSSRSTGAIGLSLARLLADEMGGRLHIDSSVGVGTTAVATFRNRSLGAAQSSVGKAA